MLQYFPMTIKFVKVEKSVKLEVQWNKQQFWFGIIESLIN